MIRPRFHIGQQVLVLAVPVLIEQLLLSSVALVDTFLARMNPEATAAVGLASYVSWLAGLIFSLVSVGTTALVARYWGAAKYGLAQRVSNQSVAVGVVLGFLVAAALFLAAPVLVQLQNLSGTAYQVAVRYLRIDSLGHVFTGITMIGAAALRGCGYMRTPMLVLGSMSLLNMLLSVLLVHGVGFLPALGIDGIVAGTLSARALSGLIMIGVFLAASNPIRWRRRFLKPRRREVGRILRIGIPAALDGGLMWAGHFLFLMIVGRVDSGSRAVASYAAHIIAIRCEALTYLPAIAWGTAAATLVGQSLGAAAPIRARRAGHQCALQCGLISCLIGVLFFAGADTIYKLMHSDPHVRAIGTDPFRINAFFQPLMAISIVYVAALRGAGDTRFPLIITAFGIVALRLPLGYFFGIWLGWGLLGAWIGMWGDLTLRSLMGTLRFCSDQWRHVRV